MRASIRRPRCFWHQPFRFDASHRFRTRLRSHQNYAGIAFVTRLASLRSTKDPMAVEPGGPWEKDDDCGNTGPSDFGDGAGRGLERVAHIQHEKKQGENCEGVFADGVAST